jgi:hypothetical protein
MTPTMKNETETKPEATVTCVVTVDGTTIGQAVLAAGHRLTLPKSAAETLAGMTPPRITITGL